MEEFMGISSAGWANQTGTADRSCAPCGSWKDHWVKLSKKIWPNLCSVDKCSLPATLGAHIIHPDAMGEIIVPMCDNCNKLKTVFNLKMGTSLISARQCS